MRTKKQCLCLVVAFILLFSLCTTASATESGLPFTDVPESHWAYDAIKFVYNHDLMEGVSSTSFAPGVILNRAMVVTILYRLAKEPVYFEEPAFTDILPGSFYYDAVCWASEVGITTGRTATTFEPFTQVTQEEVLVFLYRYATYEDCENMSYFLPNPGHISENIGTSGYSYTVDPFAYDAVDWAVNCGILDDTTYYNGRTLSSRARCADYFHRYCSLASGNGRVFGYTGFYTGFAYDHIAGYMMNMDYHVGTFFDVYPIAMNYALCNTDIVFSVSHGGTNSLQLADDKYLHSSDIIMDSMNHVDLVYLGSCYAGNGLLSTMCDYGGAQAGVGFTDTINYNLDTEGGSLYFHERFFYYLQKGRYSIETCCEKALSDMEDRYNRANPYRVGCYVTYGEFEYE